MHHRRISSRRGKIRRTRRSSSLSFSSKGIKKTFLTGLIALLPFAVTIAIALWLLNFLTKPFMGLVTPFLSNLPISETLILRMSQLIILLGLALLILCLGIVAQWFFFHGLLSAGDRLLSKIPIVKKIYKVAKDLIQSLFMSDSSSFQQVVMAPFPYQGSYVLGLVAARAPETCSDASGEEEMISIFLPTAPNPSTGFLIMRPKSELIFLEMHSKDALKYIISCGVVPPEPVEAP